MGCLSWEGPTGSRPASLGLPLRSSGALPGQAPFPPAPGAAATGWASRLPASRGPARGSTVCSASPALGEPLALRPPRNLTLGPLQ